MAGDGRFGHGAATFDSAMGSIMKTLLREPLAHFLLIGCGLFLAYAWMNRGGEDESAVADNRIHITEGDIRWMTETWSKQWQRQPTNEELNGLVSDYVREQLLAREALELGLDENDTLIRRRLAQKVEFLVRDTALLAEPDEEELRAYHERNADRYRSDGTVSFIHVFFSTDARAQATEDARVVLASLEGGPDRAATLGDRSLLGHEFSEMNGSAVRSVFGPEFAEELMTIEPHVWSGPIASAYGIHLVYATQLEPPAPLTFEETRERVRIDWEAEQQTRVNKAYFEALLRKYEVVIDAPVKELAGPIEVAGGREI